MNACLIYFEVLINLCLQRFETFGVLLSGSVMVSDHSNQVPNPIWGGGAHAIPKYVFSFFHLGHMMSTMHGNDQITKINNKEFRKAVFSVRLRQSKNKWAQVTVS